MSLEYNIWLVLLSLFVSVQGAYVGLNLARQLADRPQHVRLLLAGATATLTTAIWSMHFIGMLAARLPMPVDYLVLPTLLSALIAALFVGLAIFVAASFPANRPMLWVAAATMGTGIVAMHFTGMFALSDAAIVQHDPRFVVASWLVGVCASGLAMHYAFADKGRTPLALASLALGLAISGMHYTAMTGMTLCVAPAAAPPGDMALSPNALAVLVALVAFGLSALFLLVLVPDHPIIASAGEVKSALMASPAEPMQPEGTGAHLFHEAVLAQVAAKRTATAAEPPARGAETRAQAVQSALAGAVLPVRQHGTLRNLPITLVHAVRADAHYTWVFDGREAHFCILPIAEVERRLTAPRFARVHRSHLVAVDKIIRLRKSGDGGIVDLDSEVPYSLPVSRRQLPLVKSALGGRA